MKEQPTNTQVKEKTLKNGNPINKERQFGNPNGNRQGKGFWKKEQTPRYKLEQMLKMDKEKITGIMNDPLAPLFDRKIAESLLNEKSFKGLESMINQVYGPPKQTAEPLTKDEGYNISITIKDFSSVDNHS